MILQNKRDREAWIREKTIESLKANTFLQENDLVLVAETNCFYKVITERTDITLQNNLYAKAQSSEIVGNSSTADKLKNPRNIALSGDVTGNADFDGSKNVTINTTVQDDSHNHSNNTITSLDASKINTGTLNTDRLPILPSDKIPNLDASKITSGTINIDRLPQGALERCVVVADDSARFKLTSSQVQVGDTVKVTNTNKMYFVIDISKLNSEAGYTVYTAGTATEVPWSGVTGKPNSYPPEEHTHTQYPTVDVVENALNQKADKVHTHTKSQITDFPTALPNPHSLVIQANGSSLGDYNGSASKTFNITASNVGAYTKGEVDEKLNGKANSSHGTHIPSPQSANNKVYLRNDNTWHTITPQEIGAQPAGSYASSSHTHPASQVTQDSNNRFVTDAEKNKWNGKADAHSHPYLSTGGGTLSGALTVQGNVTCSDCITTSDERLKKDIVKIDNALEKVNQLNGYTFLKEGDHQRTTGVLAQELLNILPEAVFQREDGYYAVSYGNIVGLLIEAIKELQEVVINGKC